LTGFSASASHDSAPTTGWHLEHAGLATLGIDDGPNIQVLQQGTLRDALSQLLD
jgi:hypothetical protein